MKTQSVPDTLPQSGSRTLEEIEREISNLQRRKAEHMNNIISALKVAVEAEGETFRAALAQAVRLDRTPPSRESLDRAESALRQAEEHLAGFDGAIQAIEPERRAAQDRQETALRDRLLEELATRRADAARYKAEVAAAQAKWAEAEQRIPGLTQEITRLNIRVGMPAKA